MSSEINKEVLIGKKIKILDSNNASNLGICGVIMDETFHTLKIKCGRGIKTVFKKNILFSFEKEQKEYIIDGKKTDKRPYDRIKVAYSK